ncbi:ankyrin repeat-containing domain protein [Phaeosphaeriaceae sp. PMI808]|nr:ankyrin repeat-containing domain protein [Phaeosphaeriaceae sp. PMI808]
MAKVTYQLYLAHLIGFGCERSAERALYNLRISARLGFQDAQKEIYATHAALSMTMTSVEQEEIGGWLTQEALRGDKSCLQELKVFDKGAYQTVATSAARRKAMCERSGFIFDDDFIESQDVGNVEQFISKVQSSGEPIDEDIGGGMTWLHYAVFMNSLELATCLVKDFNFPINVSNCSGQTPLWIACLSGNYEMVALLLSHDADARIESGQGSNCLHHLAAFDERYTAEVSQQLQIRGAEVNGQNVAGLTPLHYAIRGSGPLLEEPSVAALLELGANPLISDEDGDTPLDSAIYTMRIFYLKRLLSSEILNTVPKTEMDKTLANAFGIWIRQMKHHRLRSGSADYTDRLSHMIQLLHTDDILPVYVANHPAGFTPLHDAYAWSSDDLAAEIIKQPNVRLDELDAGEYGYTPLMIAIRTSARPVIEELVRAGADPLIRARTGENVLHHCVQYNPGLLLYMCEQIEKRHGDTATMCNQASFRKEQTPLDYALSLGQADAASFLLSKGANPNIFRESREDGGLKLNSLRSCLLPPNVRMLELLLPYMDSGSFVCSSNGMNLLHLACIHIHDEAKGSDNTVATFINAVIDHFPAAINAPGSTNSTTPLHLAAAYGNITAVKVLLRRGASPTVTDKDDGRPIDDIEEGEEIIDKYGNLVVGVVRQRLLRRWRHAKEILRRAIELSVRQDSEV